jgi:WD40 repeat protein
VARIFLSHSSLDNRQAIALTKWLLQNEAGLKGEIFLDLNSDTGIRSGQRWKEALLRANARCEAVICLLSKSWETSAECKSEYRTAENMGKLMFCARLEELAHEDPTREWQRVDLFGEGEQTTIDIKGGAPVSFSTEGLFRLRADIRAAGISAEKFEWPPPKDPDRPPYRGWEPMDEADAAVFFGRDAPIVRGLDELRRIRTSGAKTMFVILGPSGAGKSSFLRAGLLPRLRKDDRNFLLVDTVRPERNVLTSDTGGLANAIHLTRRRLGLTRPGLGRIKQACTDDVERVRELLLETQEKASAALLDKSSGSPLPTLLLPVDQAEELFSADAGAEAPQFLKMIAQLAHDVDSARALRLIVAVTIRTDRYETLQNAPQLADVESLVFDALKPMPLAQFKEVIVGPAARATEGGQPLKVEPGLVERLLADCAEPGDTLPLLSLTLAQLYRDWEDEGKLTLAAYESMGGMHRVVQTVIDGILADEPAERKTQLEQLRAAFIPWLAEINNNDLALRRVARWADIPADSRALLGRFIEKRLLVIRGDPYGGEVSVEVAMESLLRQWDTLTGWLDEERENLKKADALERAAADWEKNRRNDAWLLEGERLDDAETLVKRPGFRERLSGTHEYLLASRTREDDHIEAEKQHQAAELQAAKDRRDAAEKLAAAESTAKEKAQAHASVLRKRSWILAVVLVVTLFIATAAVYGFRKASQATVRADARTRDAITVQLVSGAQAMLAGGLAGGDVRALGQLLAARQLGSKPDSRVDPSTTLGGLLDGVARRRDELKIIEMPTCQIPTADSHSSSPRAPPPCPVHSVAFSPDGRRVVVGGDDGTLRQWDADTGQPSGEPMSAHDGTVVESLDVSSDGRYIVSGHEDKTVRLWDTATGKQVPVATMTHDNLVRSVAFNPHGNLVVSGSDDRTVRLWDTATGKQVPVATMTHDKVVRSVAFNLVGNLIVSAADDGLRLWETSTGRLLAHANSNTAMLSAAFSPDGNRLVSGDVDGTVQEWDARSAQLAGDPNIHPVGDPMRGHHSAVQSVAFNPDGSRIVSGGVDSTVRVWDAETRNPVGDPLTGHHGQVWGVAFSRDGRRIVSGSLDGTVREWDAIAGLPIPAGQRRIHAVALSPDGQQIASAGYDGTVKLWNADSGKQIGPQLGDAWPGDDHAVLSVAFSPDGSQIVSGGKDGIVCVWDVKTRDNFRLDGAPATVASCAPPTGGAAVQSVAFSVDGTRIASGGDDGAVRLWDAKTRQASGVLRTDDHHHVLSVAFSPDGHRIASSSLNTVEGINDYTVRLWNTDTGQPDGEALTGHTGWVYSVAFSPNGDRIVSGSYDRSVRVWDTATHRQIAELTGHQNSVLTVGYRNDGQWIVSAGSDGTIRMWDAATQKPIGTPMEPHPHANWVFSIAYSSDGQRIVSGEWDGNLRLWPTPTDLPKALCAKLTNNMSHQQWRDWVSPDISYVEVCPGLPIRPDS